MTRNARFSRKLSTPVAVDDLQTIAGAQSGRLVDIDSEGRPFVDFPGNSAGPLAAKFALSSIDIADLINDPSSADILLVFEDGDPGRPIIVGKVRDRLPSAGIEILIRGRRFTVETDREIELRCGDAKVRITRDGKVVVLGNDVVSRARRGNRIKGGTVNIN